MRIVLAFLVSLFVAIPAVARQHEHNPESAVVDFGVLQLVSLGTGCAPTPTVPPTPGVPAPGSPGDPCAYKIHALFPDEVSIAKGGEVSFRIHGGGHGFAIYEVSTDTTRDNIGQQLCEGDDPATIPVPGTSHACNGALGLGGNANNARSLIDAKDNVVLVVPANANTFPTTNRVWSEPGRLMSANAPAFLQGGTAAAPVGEILTYRFLKTGRYLVLCANRSHFFNDWMFGFVDVHE